VDQDDESDDSVSGGAEDGGDGAEFGGALGVGGGLVVCETPDAVDEEEDDAKENEGVGEDEEEAREVMADEAEEVMVPVVLYVGEGEVVLQREGEKEHDECFSEFLVDLDTSIARSAGLD
jgi:hypothetical protein